MLLLALVPPALIAMIVGFYLINVRIQDLDQAHEERGQTLARDVAGTAEYAIRSGDMALVEHATQIALANPTVFSVVVFSPGGKILVDAHNDNNIPQVPDESSWLEYLLRQPGLGTSVFSRPIQFPTSEAPGRVDVVLSRSETQTRQMEVLFNGLLITAMGLLVSYLLALSTSRDIIIPILRLTRAVRSFRRGQLTRRVPEQSGGELGTLERGINAMAESLLVSRQDLQGQIYQSNAELRTTLEELEIKNVELDLARRRAEEASQIKSRFLANMSHEIRTPVNGMVGFTRLLAQTEVDQEQREYVQIIENSAKNLLSIINDILDFSRIEAGKLTINHGPFNLKELVDETVGLLAPLAFEKGLELVCLVYRDVPLQLAGDALRLRQILTNLLNNAVKFTNEGQVTVRIMVHDESEDQVTIKVTVSDTGIGIEPEHQSRIFQAFSQADTRFTRRFEGTGLGLYITERFLHAMNGQIGFESTPGKGSKFWFTLPLERLPVEDRQPEQTSLQPALPHRQALVYDANHLSCLAISHLLEQWGVDVTEADSATDIRELIGQAQERHYDFVVIGLAVAQLTEGPTTELLTWLHDQRQRVITLANSVDRSVHARLRDLGAASSLPKVINRNKLLDTLCEMTDAETYPCVDETISAVSAEMPALAGLRLLVADDNRVNLRLLSTLLSRHGAKVDEVDNGEAAVAKFREAHYDALLLDVHMPVMSGVDAVKHVRQLEPAGHHTPVIAVTANAIPEEWRRFRQAGMDDCLVKPIEEAAIVECLTRLCRETADNRAAEHLENDRPQSGKRLTGDSPLMDAEVLEMLLEDLPQQQDLMNQAYGEQNLSQMIDQVHLIHGSAAFCGLSAIKEAAFVLENQLNQGGSEEGEVSYLLARLNREIDQFLRPYQNRQTAP